MQTVQKDENKIKDAGEKAHEWLLNKVVETLDSLPKLLIENDLVKRRKRQKTLPRMSNCSDSDIYGGKIIFYTIPVDISAAKKVLSKTKKVFLQPGRRMHFIDCVCICKKILAEISSQKLLAGNFGYHGIVTGIRKITVNSFSWRLFLGVLESGTLTKPLNKDSSESFVKWLFFTFGCPANLHRLRVKVYVIPVQKLVF